MKTRLAVYLGIELVLAVAIGGGVCLLRRDEVNARRAWQGNPTAEAKAELERQRAITQGQQFKLMAALFGLMALPTALLIVRASQPRESEASKTL